MSNLLSANSTDYQIMSAISRLVTLTNGLLIDVPTQVFLARQRSIVVPLVPFLARVLAGLTNMAVTIVVKVAALNVVKAQFSCHNKKTTIIVMFIQSDGKTSNILNAIT